MIRDDKKLDISISPLELSLNKYSDPVPEEVSAHKSSIWGRREDEDHNNKSLIV